MGKGRALVLCKALRPFGSHYGGWGRQAVHLPVIPVVTRCPAPQLRARLVRAATVEKTTLWPNKSPLAAPGSPWLVFLRLRSQFLHCLGGSGRDSMGTVGSSPWTSGPGHPSEQPACDWETGSLLCCGPHGNCRPFAPLQSW